MKTNQMRVVIIGIMLMEKLQSDKIEERSNLKLGCEFMKNKFRNIIFYLSLLVIIGFGLVSCGNKQNNENVIEDNKFYIDSFEYDIIKNESSVTNELSYTMTFDIGFSLSKNSTIRNLIVRIAGKQEKSFRFTMDYCNTENVTLSQSTAAYPYALLDYSAPAEASTMNVSVRLKISTVDLIDDINKFLEIDCYNNKGSQVVDRKDLTDAGIFKMEYSDNSSSDIIHYAFNDLTESYEVVSVITKSKSFEIPAIYMNYPVKTIDEGAFKAATNIEELILPNTLTSIPEGLLSGMSVLKSLSLPFVGQRIKETGKITGTFGYIFGNTDYTNGMKVKQVSKDSNNTILEYECCIPKSLTRVIVTGDSELPYGAFSNCTMLEEIELKGNIQEISEIAFSNCVNVNSFTIPDSVTSIGDKAFEYFASETDLNYLKLSDNLKTIGTNAFLGCDTITFEFPKSFLESGAKINYSNMGITSIYVSYGVTIIPEETFKDFNTLKKIFIPKSIQSFGKEAFAGCNKLESVVYEGNIQSWARLTFADAQANPLSNGNAYLYLDGVVTDGVVLEFPDTVIEINDYAFTGVQNIVNVNLPKVVSIGESAFANTPIVSVKFGDRLESIGANAFSECTRITSIDIPKSVRSIGANAFYHNSLKELSVPFIGQSQKENTYISYWFGGVSYQSNKTSLPTTLTKVSITNCDSIPAYALAGCSNITNVYLKSIITKINNNAFESCTSLAEIELNDELVTIGNLAFLDCIALSSITIPAHVKTIGEEAFSGCVNLKNIWFECKNANVMQKAFYGCSIKSLELNDEIAAFEEGVFKNCKSLTDVTFNNNISIEKDLFADCSNIQTFKTTFIGNEINKQSFFAYFFGATSYFNGVDFVPSKLTSVVVICDTISDNAFYGLKGLNKVTFTGTTISVSSFEKCSSLKEITLKEVETIKDNAFADCSSLEKVSLPKTLENIGNDAFNYTNQNKKIYYADSIDQWAEINFANTYSNPMALASSFFSQSLEITNLLFETASTIKPYAFYGFSKVTNIKLSDNTISIGASAFCSMTELTKFEAGDNLTVIDRNAFKSDSQLQEVVFNAKLTNIGEFAFMGCAALTTLRYNATVSDWVKINFANQTANPIYAQNVYMLDEANESYLLEDVYLDDKVVEISAYAFYSSNIKSLHITSSLVKIGDDAFKNCRNLKTVYYAGLEEDYQQIKNNTPFSDDIEIVFNS